MTIAHPSRRGAVGLSIAAALALSIPASARAQTDNRPVIRVSTQNKDSLELFKASKVLDDAPYRVEWSLLPTATEESAALLANAVDINVTQGTVSVALQQGNAKEPWTASTTPVKIIAAHSPRDPANYKTMVTIVHADGPIKEPKDLKGRSITFKEGGNMYTQGILSIDHAGLSASDVKIVNLNPADGLVAFRSGQVDALSNNPGRLTPLIASGKARVLLTNTDVGFPSSTATVVRTADLDDPAKVEVFRDFVKRVQLWNDWKGANPEEVEKILVEVTHLKREDASYYARAYVANVDVVDDAFLDNEQRIADILTKAGGIPRKVDVRLHFDTRFNADIASVRKIAQH